jgi:peptidoglycan/LPS O-acetylase OafA/YrhL
MIASTTPVLKVEPHHLSHPKYRPDIDGLRAIAVLAVIGFHAFPTLFPGGYIGVDIFFVISGFLISSIIFRNLEEDRFSYAEFYVRRIKRIFPALLLVLIACLICGWFEIPNEYKQMGKHVAAGAAFVSNFALWKDAGYFDAAADQKPLLHLWSLGIEEQFYIFWPLLLGFVWKRKYNFLTITLLILCGSFLVNVGTVHSHPIAAYYSPLSRFWELMIGGILAYLTLHRPHRLPKKTNWLSIVGMLMILPPVLILNKDSAFPGWWALLPTVGAFLVLSAGPAAWLNRNFLGNRPFVWIGLISYPLYLWHWPALYLFRQLFLQQYMTHAQWVLGRVCAIGAAILLSWLTYRLVEIPIRSGSPGINVTYSLAGTMAIVAIAGGVAYKTDGFAYRLSPQLAGILSFDYAYNSSVGYRMNTCLLEAYQDQKQFGNCTSYPPGKMVSDVLLWGDSHAAELYPGFQTAIGASSKLTQLTSSLCPPIIGYATKAQPHCKEINDYVMEWIAKGKPDRVVLAGLWTDYDWKQLADTVRRLKLLDVKRIDLVGPVPIWQHSLPTQLFLYARNNKSQSTIPDRMSYGLDPRVPIMDASMREFAKEIGINYYSPYTILCNADGCVTMLGDTPDQLTAWDTAHLTITASRYVVSHFTE